MALVLPHGFTPSAVVLSRNRRSKSLVSSISCNCSNSSSSFCSLSFSRNISLFHHNFSKRFWPMRAIEKTPRRQSVVCEAAPSKKADSAAKRARQAEKRRLINKSRKSEMRTRMKKVLAALDVLRKKKGAEEQEILPIEKLIGEAYSAIDKAVSRGTLHRNTGKHRKSRLARRKRAILIHHGWYTPASA